MTQKILKNSLWLLNVSLVTVVIEPRKKGKIQIPNSILWDTFPVQQIVAGFPECILSIVEYRYGCIIYLLFLQHWWFPLLALESPWCLIQDKYLMTALCVKLHLLPAHFLLECNTAGIPIAVAFHLFRAELTSLRLFQPNRGKQSPKLAEDEAYLIAIQRWFSVLLLGDKQAWACWDAGCISSASVGGTPVPCWSCSVMMWLWVWAGRKANRQRMAVLGGKQPH